MIRFNAWKVSSGFQEDGLEGKARGGEEAGARPSQSCWWWEEVGWFERHVKRNRLCGGEGE